jgi:hypothetical protein
MCEVREAMQSAHVSMWLRVDPPSRERETPVSYPRRQEV